MLVGIHSPDRDANLRYAEALTQKLLTLPKSTLAMATYHVRDLKNFFKTNKWLYVSEKDLTSIRDRLRGEISRRKNPLLVDLSDDDDESVDAMRDRLTKEDRLGAASPTACSATKTAATCGLPRFRLVASSANAAVKASTRLRPDSSAKPIPTRSTHK